MIHFKPGAPSSVVAAMSVIALLSACKPATNSAATSTAASTPTGGGLFGASAPAAAPATGGMTTFTDPTENAFTISVPQGWNAKGGVQRSSATNAKTWVQAISPDGLTTVSIGDPQIPFFTLPSQQHAAGSTVQSLSGPSPVEPYENGVQFAADYAQKAFGSSCTGLTQTGSQPLPEFVQKAQASMAQLEAALNSPPPQVDYDSAAVTFSCQVNGAPYAVGVLDVTGQQQLQFGLGNWSVVAIATYRTPAASQAQTDQLARQMSASMQPNPQWRAQMIAAGKQQLAQMQERGRQAQAALAAQASADSQMLNANEAAANQRLAANHAAFMQQQQQQANSRNAAFAQHMYNKQTGQDAEMRYINNQTCIAWYDAAHTRCRATAQQ